MCDCSRECKCVSLNGSQSEEGILNLELKVIGDVGEERNHQQGKYSGCDILRSVTGNYENDEMRSENKTW